MKHIDNIDNVLNVLGFTYGLVNVQEVLGIILLVLNICLILYKATIKIIKSIKCKKYNDIEDVLEDTIKDINNIKRGEDNANNK